jgi:hypothetical protein
MSLGSAKEKLIDELKGIGSVYKDLDHIYVQKSLNAQEVKLILKWLPPIYDEHLGSGHIMARSLISATEPYDPSILIDLFENSSFNRTIKWGIAYVLSESKTKDISDWIIDQLLNKEVSFERAGLISGIEKKVGFDETQINEFYKRIFDRYPMAILEYFKKKGTVADIDFLLDKFYIADKNIKKEIERVIKHIQKKKKTKK